MPDDPTKPVLDNEHRYMGLLALTSQELPANKSDSNADLNEMDMNKMSAEQYQEFYDRLAADPAALETYLRRERRHVDSQRSRGRVSAPLAQPTKSVWSSGVDRIVEVLFLPAVRYAAALALVAIISVTVALQFSHNDRLIDAVEQSYAALRFESANSPLTMLVLPWEKSSATLGFSPAAPSSSPTAIVFAEGLLRGKQMLSKLSGGAGAAHIAASSDDKLKLPAYFALGEWNILLWAACETKQSLPQEFWQAQLTLGKTLAATPLSDSGAAAVIANHLSRVTSLLAALARGDHPTRNAHELASELLLFREQFAPHYRDDLGGINPNVGGKL